MLRIAQLVLVVLLGAYILYGFNLEEFLSALSSLEPQLLGLLVLFEVLYYVSHAIAYWALVRKKFKVGLRDAFGATMLAWLVDLLLPSAFIEGDIVRIFSLKQYGDWASAVSYGLFFRFLLNTTLAVFILATTLLVVKTGASFANYLPIYATAVFLALASSLLIVVFIFYAERMKSLARRLVLRLPVENKESLSRDLEAFLDYVSATSRELSPTSANFWLAVIALMGQWISGIMTPYFSLKCVGVSINPILIAPGYTLLSVLSLASIGVPFMVGSVDVALVTLYLMLGVPKERAVVAALIGRGVTIVVTLSILYPIGTYYARRVFSGRNIEDLKETLNRIAREYGVNLPFVRTPQSNGS